MNKYLLLVIFFIAYQLSFAGTVDTVTIYSQSMKRNIKCVVIKPDAYSNNKTIFPTVYLLHGHSGDYSNWIKRVPQLKRYVDQFNVLIVTPHGDFSSWYFDSPVDRRMRYETHIALEVPAYIEKNYRTIKNRNGRAITGLSMGGHGGLFLGFRHASFFGACGSISGALLIEYINRNYGVERLLGDTTNKELYRQYSIMKQMESYPKDSIAVIIDCGTEDFLIDMNRAVHQKMLQLKIPHEYIERPGRHDWHYWANAVEYQLFFFRKYFDKAGIKN